MSRLRLVPFTGEDLHVVQVRFDDPETCRWLGDRHWHEMILRLAAEPPAKQRGEPVTDRRAWIVEEEDVYVGMIDVEVYEDRAASLAFVVAPPQRGRGVGRRALDALAKQLAATGVQEVFSAGPRQTTRRAYAAWRVRGSRASRLRPT